MKFDCLVLGAGMVGLGAALHLLQRGRTVALVDRRGAAEETSFGNAGIVQSEGVVPYAFPRELSKIIRYGLNASPEAHVHYRALPGLLRPLFDYWRNGSPERLIQSANAFKPLADRCILEHEALMREAGPEAERLLRRSGYLKLFRTPNLLEAEIAAEEKVRARYGVRYEAVDRSRLAELEPHLDASLAGGILLPDPVAISDPGALGKAYAELFARKGGSFLIGDAMSLRQTGAGFSLDTADGVIEGHEAVIALGAWSGDLAQRFGVRVPLFVKRGYHMHYGVQGNAGLSRPVVDAEGGYVLAPMARGIRLTTGAEFARRDAPPTPVQLEKVEPAARRLLPLAERLDAGPWLGRRPCLPDMLPIVGPAPGTKGLWLDFGHQHWGFTLGPVTGRLLAEMMTGEATFADPWPYRVERFV